MSLRADSFLLLILSLFLLFFQSACQECRDQKTYLFIGHSYQWGAPDNNRVDKRLEQGDWSQYDQLWLGGDLCARTSEKAATLDYLDRLFHISQPTTHWALGNHDLTSGHPEYISAMTGRKSFYTVSFDRLCLLILNTNFNNPQDKTIQKDQCQLLDEQYRLFESITDTISKSSHLIILHHHALLTNELTDLQYALDTVFHFYRPNLPFRCQEPATFQEIAYPRLLAVKERGVEVLLISGDLGMRQKFFQYNTKEGIWFLGSGINNSIGRKHIPPWVTNFEPDHLLLFHHCPEKRSLHWTFVPVKGLTGKNPEISDQ